MTTSTATSSGTGSHKRLVRNYLLDSHFQLKYAGFLVAVALVISASIGVVLYATARAMVRESAKVVEESRKASSESRKVSEVSRMNVRELAPESPELIAEFNREADVYDKAMAGHERAVLAQQDSLVRWQHSMIGSLVCALVLMVVLIGLFGIYFTHKVAGPIFKMGRLLKQVGEGNLRVEARLRRGDELQGFFETFAAMVSGLREFEKRQLDDMETAMEALDRGDNETARVTLQRARTAARDAIGE
jgi:nitrogen fixation/metabolism regulation signal transduction histidine kinase